jgi:hypothetical protein
MNDSRSNAGLTKHHLQIVLGLVRRANNEGRLYPLPTAPAECRALAFLERGGAVVLQQRTHASPAGYMAIVRRLDSVPPGSPMRTCVRA